jgi:tetratricopeptide (TPR) repeat protein
LMDLLKKDPNQALHYAIPLDEHGSTRGGPKGRIGVSKRWSDFSIFGNARRSTGSGTIDLGDQYYDLQRQYNMMAENLVAERDHKKAAFVYLKLLKNYQKAAETLEAGKHFQEAASIYLKYLNNKTKAAECYEKGLMTKEAILLYRELNENEKVGDLYMTLSDRSNAFSYYKKVIDEYAARGQFIKASIVGKNKMGDSTLCQSLLFEGWKTQRDPVNCLNNYLANIKDETQLYYKIKSIYKTEVSDDNRENFLNVLAHEFRKKNDLREPLKEIAHEIIAIQMEKNRSIVTQLKNFDPENAELMKDTLRFKLNKQNRS